MQVTKSCDKVVLEDCIIAALSQKFNGSTGLHLFEDAFVWFYNQPKTREIPIVEGAATAYLLYQKKGELPDFFRMYFMLIQTCDLYTEAAFAPYARGMSPLFWKHIFRVFFKSEPPSDTDKRWDELFKLGLPLYSSIENNS